MRSAFAATAHDPQDVQTCVTVQFQVPMSATRAVQGLRWASCQGHNSEPQRRTCCRVTRLTGRDVDGHALADLLHKQLVSTGVLLHHAELDLGRQPRTARQRVAGLHRQCRMRRMLVVRFCRRRCARTQEWRRRVGRGWPHRSRAALDLTRIPTLTLNLTENLSPIILSPIAAQT